MDYLLNAGILIALLFLFLAGGLWVALSLLAIGFLGIVFFSSAPAGLVRPPPSGAPAPPGP